MDSKGKGSVASTTTMSNVSHFSKENYDFPTPDKGDNPQAYKEYMRYKPIFQEKSGKQLKRWQKFWKKREELVSKKKQPYEVSSADKDSKEVKQLTRKGIPVEYRGRFWFQISGAALQRDKNKGYFQKIKSENVGKPSKTLTQINNDIDRTFPEHVFFSSKQHQNAIRDILIVYAAHNPNVGYCQGLNFLAGIIYFHLYNEEETFWLLHVMLSEYLPQDLYDDRLGGLYCECHVLQMLCQQKISKLTKHLLKLKADFPIFATSWFLCVYITVLPVETALRVWDAFFFEGYKIIYRVAVSILSTLEKDLLQTKNSGEVLMIIQQHTSTCYDARSLMKKSFAIKAFSRKIIVNSRNDYRTKVSTSEKSTNASTSTSTTTR